MLRSTCSSWSIASQSELPWRITGLCLDHFNICPILSATTTDRQTGPRRNSATTDTAEPAVV